ncbi:sorbosone dehydrogenase family protein [Mesonia sp. JHPTF-M18]|uniref:Sorbosone dehydrogenase family protein n=1 Tax=Mesonia aestuariivivens TaxID=2796128 RepID=A0ABS6W1J9_9FLAO|nr:sorbosone dehydrogenase family protein [Mesonia aestuariivivens]MBW2961730.1 sorbosone dehydrogenase family protein [Mesonia aestuariivivens]
MKNINLFSLSFIVCSFLLISCKGERKLSNETKNKIAKDSSYTTVTTAIGALSLPPAFNTESVRMQSKIINWKEGETPSAPKGFTVERFADSLEHPRWTYIADNGDYFVVESNDAKRSANRITLFRDENKNGLPDEKFTFLENLNQPFGMLIIDSYFYVANVDGLVRFPYQEGQTKIIASPEKVIDLPAGGYNHHWTRNIITNKDKSKIYITVGSSSNVGEHGMEKEERRANVLEINLDGSGERVYAAGLRNPVGIDWNPITGELWAAVNERDKLGDHLVPDYATSVKENGWYGWPYSYYGQIKDPRWKDEPHQELVNQAIIPDVPLGSHTASLGLEFYTSNKFPEKYKNGAFIGQHGSWNRSKLAGYKVVFIPFDEEGSPKTPEDFLTGFIANENGTDVHGRPVGVTQTPDGALLVNDDDAGIVWRVAFE